MMDAGRKLPVARMEPVAAEKEGQVNNNATFYTKLSRCIASSSFGDGSHYNACG